MLPNRKPSPLEVIASRKMHINNIAKLIVAISRWKIPAAMMKPNTAVTKPSSM